MSYGNRSPREGALADGLLQYVIGPRKNSVLPLVRGNRKACGSGRDIQDDFQVPDASRYNKVPTTGKAYYRATRGTPYLGVLSNRHAVV